MTGYGEASYQSDTLSLAIELRALNNRYLKVSLRAMEPYNLLEPEFEKVVRRTVRVSSPRSMVITRATPTRTRKLKRSAAERQRFRLVVRTWW